MNTLWFFLILITVIVITGIAGLVWWSNRPADEYDKLLDSLNKE